MRVFQSGLYIILFFLPTVTGLPQESSFPQIPFTNFVDIIQTIFHPYIPLSTVLLVLFTLTENTELLSLHARQQNNLLLDERSTLTSRWLKCLARALFEKLDTETFNHLFTRAELRSMKDKDKFTFLAKKLDTLAKELNLYPADNGTFQVFLINKL